MAHQKMASLSSYEQVLWEHWSSNTSSSNLRICMSWAISQDYGDLQHANHDLQDNDKGPCILPKPHSNKKENMIIWLAKKEKKTEEVREHESSYHSFEDLITLAKIAKLQSKLKKIELLKVGFTSLKVSFKFLGAKLDWSQWVVT